MPARHRFDAFSRGRVGLAGAGHGVLAGDVGGDERVADDERRLPFGIGDHIIRFGVIAGGWCRDKAQQRSVQRLQNLYGPQPGERSTFEVNVGLVAKSLVAEPWAGPRRYRMLETIREYAAALLEEAGDAGLTRRRHSQAYLDLARQERDHKCS